MKEALHPQQARPYQPHGTPIALPTQAPQDLAVRVEHVVGGADFWLGAREEEEQDEEVAGDDEVGAGICWVRKMRKVIRKGKKFGKCEVVVVALDGIDGSGRKGKGKVGVGWM